MIFHLLFNWLFYCIIILSLTNSNFIFITMFKFYSHKISKCIRRFWSHLSYLKIFDLINFHNILACDVINIVWGNQQIRLDAYHESWILRVLLWWTNYNGLAFRSRSMKSRLSLSFCLIKRLAIQIQWLVILILSSTQRLVIENC